MRLGRTLPVLTLALASVTGTFACGWPGGVGAVLRWRGAEHRLFVERFNRDSAAERAGLRANDEVLAIDGTPVANLDEATLRERLRGEVGASLTVRVRHDGAERDVTIVRAPYR